MKSLKTILGIALATATFGGAVAAGAVATNVSSNHVEMAEATDYSSTIRVYLDFNTTAWGTITDIRIGGNGSGNNVVASSSNAKYNQSLGNYVKDISSSTNYNKMGCFFKENGTQWQYQYDGGYIYIDSSEFAPGYEFQIKNIAWVSDGSGYKNFKCDVYRIGEITDNVQNSTFYFVDGFSWHTSTTVNAHFWGGTASSTYPGPAMTDSSLRLKAYVDEAEFAGLHIYKYTLSGSAAYVKFSNNNGGQETGDLRLEANKVYFYHVSAETYEIVVNFLINVQSQMGAATYNGRNFSKSICALSQSQAQSFVSTYKDLSENHGSGVASSVAGSGIVTYSTPEINNTTTGEMSLAQMRDALLNKYPSISASNKIAAISESSNQSKIILAVTVIGVSITAVVALSFVLKKKKHQ